MNTRSLATRLVVAAGAAATAGLVTFGAPATAEAAFGVFVWNGDKYIPNPVEDQCYPTPGGMMADNMSFGDAFLYTDAKCTIGKDAGNAGPFASADVPFESVRLRTEAG